MAILSIPTEHLQLSDPTEIKAFLNSSKYYVDFSGRLTFSAATDTVNYVVKNLTGF
jgi:hypothetical protein